MLSRTDEDDLNSVAYTYMVGRTHFDSRLVLTGSTKQEIISGLDEYLDKDSTKSKKYYSNSGSASKVSSIFLYILESTSFIL